jgi:RimJ/RimL family protein N-acetyltransferase
MDRDIHYSYTYGNHSIVLYKLNLKLDFDTLYKWMHEPHVIKHWQLNKPRSELYQYFESILLQEYQELFMLEINGNIIGYAETYSAIHDRLSHFYTSQSGDYGIYLLIGESLSLGQGFSKLIIRCLTDYLFTAHNAIRVLIEPSIEVKQFNYLEAKLGFKRLGLINFPEKTAILYAISRYDFYTLSPRDIGCDISNWPIVRLHFPSYPVDNAVVQWLHKLDTIITIGAPFVVISTFDTDYQFSQASRKEQVFWFKRNKSLLEKYCLGMLRVTTDPVMREKLNNPAMHRNMPFRCIPCTSLEHAEQMASLCVSEFGGKL